MTEELKPEVIIVDGYKVDKRYSVEVALSNTLIVKYCNKPAWSCEQRVFESNVELQKILENQLEVAFAQGYEVCYEELIKPTFTKEDVEKATLSELGVK